LRSTKLITISLSPELYEKALKLAKEEDRTRSGIFREALRRYIKEKERQSSPQVLQSPYDLNRYPYQK
jgi:predicted transcriptional regulator